MKNKGDILLKLTNILDKIVSIIILLVAIRLVIYITTSFGATIYGIYTSGLWLSNHDEDILHQIVSMIIAVKAYKILIYYAKYHHINIKYITELMIISCFIEFIFHIKIMELYNLILLALSGIITLVVYIKYYDTLNIASMHETNNILK